MIATNPYKTAHYEKGLLTLHVSVHDVISGLDVARIARLLFGECTVVFLFIVVTKEFNIPTRRKKDLSKQTKYISEKKIKSKSLL